jgi:Predicted membrane protein
MLHKTWHDRHRESLNFGQRLADKVANGMGSWKFIIIQTLFVVLWMGLNVIGFVYHWDAYPFILLNLLFSTQAAYAAPIIMMAQNRQNERDRVQAHADYQTNVEAKLEIEALQKKLNSIEVEKLNKIIEMLEEMKEGK